MGKVRVIEIHESVTAANDREAEAIRRKMDGTVRCEVLQTLPDGVMAAHGPLVP